MISKKIAEKLSSIKNEYFKIAIILVPFVIIFGTFHLFLYDYLYSLMGLSLYPESWNNKISFFVSLIITFIIQQPITTILINLLKKEKTSL